MKEGWKVVKIKDICEASNGLWKGKKPPYKKIAVIRNTNFSKDCKLKLDNVEYIDVEERQYISRKLEYGDIIIEKSGGSDKQPVGRPILFNVIEGDFSYSNFTSRLRINDSGGVDSHYLHKVLYHLYLEGATFNLQSNTTGIHNLDLKGYLELEIPLPPLPEQHRIVKKLDAAFEKIDAMKAKAEKNIENAKALFQQTLAAELEPKEGWVEKKLGEIGIGKMSYGSATSSKDYDGSTRYVRITDIDDDGNLQHEKKSPLFYTEKYILEDGDLLFARTGATVGKTYLYKSTDGRCLYAGYLIRLKVNTRIMNPIYLFYCTKTNRYKDFIRISQKAAAQPNINAEIYSNYLVSFPQDKKSNNKSSPN